MNEQTTQEILLQRINKLSREMGQLKRDLLRNWDTSQQKRKPRPTLFGSVSSKDIPPEMIEESRKSLFRPLDDL
jgi:type II secretory pathway component PulJ